MKLPCFTAYQSLSAAISNGTTTRGTEQVASLSLDQRSILPAVRVNKADMTDEEWLNEICLDSSDIPNLSYTQLARTWHRDNRAATYGDHLTFRLYNANDRVIDTCHVYQEMTADGCLVTICRNNYGGHGTPIGDGFYLYARDTNPG